MMASENPDIKELIDKDEGLRSKKRLLTTVSLILLGITLSGAKVIEANTFVLKINFSNQEGLSFLLMVSIVFLLVRYYNYAVPYHSKLYLSWTKRMLRDPFFIEHEEHSGDSSGILIKLYPNEIPNGYPDDDRDSSVVFGYSIKCFLRRYIEYNWSNKHTDGVVSESVFEKAGLKIYLKVLLYEIKYQASGFFTHRENLDILAPYVIGVTAICSYFFNEQFQLMVAFVLGSK